MPVRQPVERRPDVVTLAPAFVERPVATAHSPEVEPKCRKAQLVERAGNTKNELEVHRAAVQRMRVADNGRVPWLRSFRVAGFVDGLELPGLSGNDDITCEKSACHEAAIRTTAPLGLASIGAVRGKQHRKLHPAETAAKSTGRGEFGQNGPCAMRAIVPQRVGVTILLFWRYPGARVAERQNPPHAVANLSVPVPPGRWF